MPPGPNPDPTSAAGNGRVPHISMAAMESHLDTLFIGEKSQDPTLPFLDSEMPEPRIKHPSDAQVVDLNTTSQQELLAAASGTMQGDIGDIMLPELPSIPKGKLGVMQGEEVREKLRKRELSSDG